MSISFTKSTKKRQFSSPTYLPGVHLPRVRKTKRPSFINFYQKLTSLKNHWYTLQNNSSQIWWLTVVTYQSAVVGLQISRESADRTRVACTVVSKSRDVCSLYSHCSESRAAAAAAAACVNTCSKASSRLVTYVCIYKLTEFNIHELVGLPWKRVVARRIGTLIKTLRRLGNGGWFFLPGRSGIPRERRKLPQRPPGRNPGPNTFW